MSLTLAYADILVKGHFNPYIITPEWLLRAKIISADDEIEVVFGALTHGVAFRTESFEWEVDFDHLAVSSRRAADCGALAEKVLSALPHTPVRAVGHNFQYACPAAEWGDGPRPMLGPLAPGGFCELGEEHQVRWIGTFYREGARLEITVAHGLGGAAVVLNFQRAVETNRADEARQAVARFMADRAASEELIGTLLNKRAVS